MGVRVGAGRGVAVSVGVNAKVEVGVGVAVGVGLGVGAAVEVGGGGATVIVEAGVGVDVSVSVAVGASVGWSVGGFAGLASSTLSPEAEAGGRVGPAGAAPNSRCGASPPPPQETSRRSKVKASGSEIRRMVVVGALPFLQRGAGRLCASAAPHGGAAALAPRCRLPVIP